MYEELIEKLRTAFPSVVNGPAAGVFAEEAELTKDLVVDGMGKVDMVILYRKGARPYRDAETKQFMEANNWFSDVSDEELSQSQTALYGIFSLMKGG